MIPVIFSRKAEDDLEAIADYIAQDNPTRALSFLQELRKQCANLGLFPNAHPRFPELGERSRVMPYKNYVVLYRVLDDTVSIERIIQGARDILNLLRDE
jgi:toxin ParE1/3/4